MRHGLRIRLAPVFLFLVLATVGAYLLWRGLSFYALAVDARVDHPDFQLLRPSGLLGNGLGYAGALLVFLNLLYLVRRRQIFTMGSMRLWLDLHTFTGLLAAELAAFHSAFQLRTPIARLTGLGLGIVVVTGIIGRSIHALVGRASTRRVLPIADELEEQAPGLGAVVLTAAEACAPTILPANASHLRCLLTLPRWRREARDRREAVLLLTRVSPLYAEAVRRVGPAIDVLVARAAAAAAAEVRSISRSALLRSWRSLHRLFAILVLLAVAVHAGVAWHFGYRWIFD